MSETRKLSTILFADIVGYTSIMQKNEGIAMKYLQKFKQILEQTVSQFNGSIVQYYGDGCLLTFDSTTSGVKCAIALQNEFIKKELSVRIGVHLGEVVFAENNVFGDGVNIASRIESMGIPGSVLISSSIRHQIKNKDEFELQSLGTFEFKNVTEPMEVYALKNHGLKVPDKAKIQGKLKESKPKSIKWKWVVGIAISLFVLIISAYSYMTKENIKSLIDNSNYSIAVVPFVNLNKIDTLDYFSDGITQEITNELAKIKSFNITPFTTTYPYKYQKKSNDQIAEELDVTYILTGAIRFFDNNKKASFSLELFNPHDSKILWSLPFNVLIDDAQRIQLEVAKEVVENLGIELSIPERKELEEPNTSNGLAFRYFMKAKSEVNKLTPSGFENAERLLKKALELDPEYDQAYSLLAWNYGIGGSPDFVSRTKSSKHLDSLAKPLLKKAMDLNPESSDNYIIKGFINLYLRNNILDAKADVDQAISIKSWPKIPIDYCICTAVSTYIALNNLDRAKEMAILAQEIDPGHALYDWDLGNIAMKEGDYITAQEHYLNSVKKMDHHSFNTFLGWNYYENGQYDKALQFLIKSYNSTEDPTRFSVAFLSNTYYRMGDQKSSDKYFKELLDRNESGEYHLNLQIALIYLERNNIDKTLDFLEKGVENSDFGFAAFLSLMPEFKLLIDEPRFQKILTEIQSPGF